MSIDMAEMEEDDLNMDLKITALFPLLRDQVDSGQNIDMKQAPKVSIDMEKMEEGGMRWALRESIDLQGMNLKGEDRKRKEKKMMMKKRGVDSGLITLLPLSKVLLRTLEIPKRFHLLSMILPANRSRRSRLIKAPDLPHWRILFLKAGL
jgi:hypothetical protein